MTLMPPKFLKIEKRGRRFRVLNSKRNRTFWEQLQRGNWEETTFLILDHFVTEDVRYIDVGCWIGPTVLYAAQVAASTHAFEPDPIANEEMAVNLLANRDAPWADRICFNRKAIAPAPGALQLGSKGDGGDSMSSTLFADNRTSWTVEAISLPDYLASKGALGGKNFLKIDIEGGEFALIPAIETYLRSEDVTLYISVHTSFLAATLGTGRGFLRKVWRRFALTYEHRRLCQSLPFTYFYKGDGSPVSVGRLLFDLFITGNFPMEILASNSKWELEQ